MSRRPEHAENVVSLKDVNTQVAQLVGQMQAMNQRNLHSDTLHADHENRLRILERWRYSIPASLVLSAATLLQVLTAHK